MRRVVVTGMGIVCPLGLGVEHVWRRLVNAESGISAIPAFVSNDLPCKVAGQVPQGTKADGNLDIGEWISIKDQKKMDRFVHMAMVAGTLAVEDAGWVQTEAEYERGAKLNAQMTQGEKIIERDDAPAGGRPASAPQGDNKTDTM